MSRATGYYNGKIGPLEELTCPLNDRAVYFGDGCYDATMMVNKKPFLFDEHIDRFFNSCKLLDIKFPYTREELKAELMKLADAYGFESGLLYWQTSRGTEIRHHDFPKSDAIKPNLMAFVKPMEMCSRKKYFKLVTTPDLRHHMLNIKTLNLLGSVLGMEKAYAAGCDEVVFHRDGRVTECAANNVSILKDGVFRTAPTDNLILPGISRKHLIIHCKELGVPVDETPFQVEDLFTADEVIISGSGEICSIATEIDGKPVGGKARELAEKIQETVYKEFEDYINSIND